MANKSENESSNCEWKINAKCAQIIANWPFDLVIHTVASDYQRLHKKNLGLENEALGPASACGK